MTKKAFFSFWLLLMSLSAVMAQTVNLKATAREGIISLQGSFDEPTLSQGFEYRLKGTESWTSVPVTGAFETTIKVAVSGMYQVRSFVGTAGQGTLYSRTKQVFAMCDCPASCETPLSQPNPAAASISSNCATHTFNLGVATGGLGEITYQWEQSVNGSTGWTNAAGTSNTQHYTTPALTSNIYYRRVAANATCELTHTSHAALVTVEVTPTVCAQKGGIEINGVCWAPTNVDAPGTFAANPEDVGMFYQWNRRNAWAVTGGVTGWDNSNAPGTTWAAANDPSPAGWRVPTNGELRKLLDANNVTYEWVTQNGVNGGKFTDKTSCNSLFLPAAGVRHFFSGTLSDAGTYGRYWSSMADESFEAGAHGMFFRSGNADWYYVNRPTGLSVRAVAK